MVQEEASSDRQKNAGRRYLITDTPYSKSLGYPRSPERDELLNVAAGLTLSGFLPMFGKFPVPKIEYKISD